MTTLFIIAAVVFAISFVVSAAIQHFLYDFVCYGGALRFSIVAAMSVVAVVNFSNVLVADSNRELADKWRAVDGSSVSTDGRYVTVGIPGSYTDTKGVKHDFVRRGSMSIDSARYFGVIEGQPINPPYYKAVWPFFLIVSIFALFFPQLVFLGAFFLHILKQCFSKEKLDAHAD